MVSVHHGRESMVQQNSSHHGERERGREGKRERERDACASGLSHFSLFVQSRLTTYEVVAPTFRSNLPCLVNLLWKYLHRHIQRCVLLIS
jgi:hypothetical protein